jgi:hypothetical protein
VTTRPTTRLAVPLFISLLCGTLGLSARAQAQQPAPQPPPYYGQPAPAPPPPGYPPPGYGAPPGYPPPQPGYYRGPYGGVQSRAPGAETHDGGYLRLQLGFGYTSLSASDPVNSVTISGGGAGFGIAAGGAIARNLIIYGTILDSLASSPTVESTTGGQTTSGTLNNASAGVVGFGGGLAYYLDSNVFFAGSLLASRMVVTDSNGNDIFRSELGFTFEGLIGKEWWASDNWGLGVSAQVLVGAMKDHPTIAGEAVPTWHVATFNVLFSATYN